MKLRLSRPKAAIIFDYDGVVIDSQVVHAEIESQMLATLQAPRSNYLLHCSHDVLVYAS